MPKLPGIRHKDAIRVLERVGWRVIREGKHTIMGKGTDAIPIPRHNPINAFTIGPDCPSGGPHPGTVPGVAVRYDEGRLAMSKRPKTKNAAAKSISDELRDDTDFAYFDKLPAHEQAVAVFYEYTREFAKCSDGFAAMVRDLHALNAFETPDNTPSEEAIERAFSIIFSVTRRYAFDCGELMLLMACRGFPETPFRDCRDAYKGCIVPDHFGIYDRLYVKEWDMLLANRDVAMKGAAIAAKYPDDPKFDYGRITELEFFEQSFSGKGWTRVALEIPWCCTNDELVDMFCESLEKLRPAEFPEPPKTGRGGLTDAKTKLRQLIVFRLHQAGFSFDSGREFHNGYTSAEGWWKAVRSARERIQSMHERPFFKSRRGKMPK